MHKINVIALIAAAAKAGYTGKTFESAVRDRANEMSSRLSRGQPLGQSHPIQAVEIAAFAAVGWEMDSVACKDIAEPLGLRLANLQGQARDERNRVQKA